MINAPIWLNASSPYSAKLNTKKRTSKYKHYQPYVNHPVQAYFIEPPIPIIKAITNSVADAMRPGTPITYIKEGTPTKPPTAMMDASIPVANLLER